MFRLFHWQYIEKILFWSFRCCFIFYLWWVLKTQLYWSHNQEALVQFNVFYYDFNWLKSSKSFWSKDINKLLWQSDELSRFIFTCTVSRRLVFLIVPLGMNTFDTVCRWRLVTLWTSADIVLHWNTLVSVDEHSWNSKDELVTMLT